MIKMVVRGLGHSGQNEAGLKSWIVYIDSNRDGVRGANEQYTYTDAKGNYTFDLAPGTYRIAEELQRGWTQTNPLNPVMEKVKY
jgi:hypothetical protein